MPTKQLTFDGALFKQRRLALGMTQLQLAERLYCTDACVSQWENGKKKPYSWGAIERLLELVEQEEKEKAPEG